jgi:hypothetical protein
MTLCCSVFVSKWLVTFGQESNMFNRIIFIFLFKNNRSFKKNSSLLKKAVSFLLINHLSKHLFLFLFFLCRNFDNTKSQEANKNGVLRNPQSKDPRVIRNLIWKLKPKYNFQPTFQKICSKNENTKFYLFWVETNKNWEFQWLLLDFPRTATTKTKNLQILKILSFR